MKIKHPLPLGTLVEWSSFGSSYHGFIVGACSYDNHGPANAYVVRYCYRNPEEQARKSYSIVDMIRVELIREWPDDFVVDGHWSATPTDRCNQWHVERSDGLLLVKGGG